MMATPPSSRNYSGRLARKGVLLEETYRVFGHWQAGLDLRQNLQFIRAHNPVGALNAAWLREVTATLSSRFSNGPSIDPLVLLAKGGFPFEAWKFCLLWHLGSTDGLYHDFAAQFLFPKVQQGIAVFTTDDVIPFVREWVAQGVFAEPLTDYGVRRMGRDLLRIAAAFGFVQGNARREVAHPAIHESVLLYALHDLVGSGLSAAAVIESERWRLFLMTPAQVEHELLNLHQFRRLHYECAGSIRELSLPHSNLMAFAQSLVA
jgi:hypothetical protein